jgi:cyclohexyl-isocyanide hydratase
LAADHSDHMSLDIAFLVYPGVALLDLAGPYEVLHRVPGARLHLVGRTRGPVVSDTDAALVPTATFADVRAADVLCIPGGGGQIDLMDDAETIGWVREIGATASWVTSVCTGSFVLGEADLLRGYRATTHWASFPFLAAYGAIPVEERVVVDRNRVTAAGVTAGIDLALRLAALLASDTVAEAIQLGLEYDPAPPFNSGNPRAARPPVVDLVRARFATRIDRRSAQAAARRGDAT